MIDEEFYVFVKELFVFYYLLKEIVRLKRLFVVLYVLFLFYFKVLVNGMFSFVVGGVVIFVDVVFMM